MKKTILALLIAVPLLLAAQPPSGDNRVNYRVLLDKYVPAGDLTLFQSMDNPNDYLYLPNKARVVRNENGQPKFGLQLYKRNERAGAGEDARDKRASGGATCWLSVGFTVTEEDKQEALQILRQTNPSGRIAGAMAYDYGVAKLLTVGMTGEGEEKTEVLGLASAPLKEGDEAPVLFVLSKDNAIKLREALDMPDPPIKIELNMRYRGFQSPVSAEITLDKEKISRNRRFGAAIAAPMLQAEIEQLSQEMIDDGAIEYKVVGDLGPDLDRLMNEITRTLINNCFQPVTIGEMMSMTNSMGGNELDRAVGSLNAMNNRNQQPGTPATTTRPGATSPSPRPSTGTPPAATRPTTPPAATRPASTPAATTAPPDPRAAQPSRPAPATGAPDPRAGAATTTQSATTPPAPEAPATAPATTRPTTPPATTAPSQGPARTQTAPAATAPSQSQTPGRQPAAGQTPSAQPQNQQQNAGSSTSNISIAFSYRARDLTVRGTQTVKLSATRPAIDDRVAGFELGRIPANCIQEIDLDDPLFWQKEVSAYLDGSGQSDFSEYINFVNVTMRKRYPDGDTKTDQLTIDRQKFNREDNRFALMYSWKAGLARDPQWDTYEYKETWSFFGGAKVETDWARSSEPAINLSPPLKKEAIEVFADVETMRQQNVRAVSLQVFYEVGGRPLSKTMSFNLSQNQPGGTLEIISNPDQLNFEYEIRWIFAGNRSETSGRQRGESNFLDLTYDR
jgi:hypothetical protein